MRRSNRKNMINTLIGFKKSQLHKFMLLTINIIFIASSLSAREPAVINYGNFGFGLSSSLFNSQSHETLYHPTGSYYAGMKLSELTWKAKDVNLVGFDLTYSHSNYDLYFSYKKSVGNNGNGLMTDLDWLWVTDPTLLSHWSHHEDTDVTNVSIMDFGIRKSVKFEYVVPWIGVGYREENQRYKAYNGYGSYYDTPITFSGLAITFDQEYKGVYLSTGLDLKFGGFTLYGSAKYSPFINANFTDRHHMRYFTMTTSFDETSMLNLNAGLGYSLNTHHSIAVTYEETEYTYIRGNRTRTYDWGSLNRWDDSVALDSKNRLVNITYKYRF